MLPSVTCRVLGASPRVSVESEAGNVVASDGDRLEGRVAIDAKRAVSAK